MYVKKKLCKAFCGFWGSCAKFDELPQMMPLKAASVGAEDYKFENEKNLGGVELERNKVTRSTQSHDDCLRLADPGYISHY